jgi:hypothetical protein
MFDWNATSRALTAQLANPADVFTLLFLVGGDVVQTALAQNAGFRMVELPFWPTNTKTTHKSKWTSVGNNIRPPKWKYSVRFSPVGWGFTPVVFSFGWVSYAFTTLKTAAGGETLMPVSTAQNVVVMEGKSGHTRSNTSWVIGRLWRDYPVWRDKRWYLIGIGAIGMLQNTWAASSPRRPEEVGLPLEFVEVVGSADVACALAQLEKTDEGRGVGKKLVQIFFPGDWRRATRTFLVHRGSERI